MWKRVFAVAALLLLTSAVLAQVKAKSEPKIPALLIQARFVYVTTYDGPMNSTFMLPEEREALVRVEDALKDWGRYQVVYEPQKADLIVTVMRRPGEDVLAVYNAQFGLNSSPLYWKSQRGGLEPPDLPLFRQFQQQVDRQAELAEK